MPAEATATAAAPAPPPIRRRVRGREGHRVARALPLLPAVVLLALFMLGPVVWSFYGSFTNSALTGPNALNPSFVGWSNYANLLTDPEFAKSILLTVLFVFASAIVGQNVLGLLIAILQRHALPAVRAVVGTFVVGAWVLPEIVAAFTMYAFFSDGGTLSNSLAALNLPAINFLYDHPMLSVIGANIWRGTAFSMMVYAAALTDVPPEITEAAEVDGASRWQSLLHITLPMIRRSISTNLMLTTLQTLSVFTLIYVMTSGGPGTDSSTLPILAYQQAFKFAQIGYGTAIATVMLLIGAVFSIIYLRLLKPEVD